MQFLGVKKWCNVNVYSDTEHKHVYWKTSKKVRNYFGCVSGAYYFQCQVS